MTVDFIMTRI